MSGTFREGKSWHIWLTVLAILVVGIGIYFYYTFFRQSESDVVESVPPDAIYVFDINNNSDFAGKYPYFSNYLNEIFALDALPAFETMCSKIRSSDSRFTISAHQYDDGIKLLFNLRASKSDFNNLLRALKIDQKNYTNFENSKIYSYGTNFQNMKFSYSNNVISFSTDPDLLKKAILQQIHPKKIFSNKDFQKVYSISEKNRKQNWLLINQESYLNYLKYLLKTETINDLREELIQSSWIGFQIRFSKNEIFLSGYSLSENIDNVIEQGNGFNLASLVPNNSKRFSRFETFATKDLSMLSNYKFPKESSRILEGLSVKELCTFVCKHDTSYVSLLSLLSGTNVSVLTFFAGTKVSDSLIRATIDNIYPLPEVFSTTLTSLVSDTLRWFVEINGGLVFSPSRDVLLRYRKMITKNEILSQNPTYKIISDAVASSAVREITLFNEPDDDYFSAILSESGTKTMLGHNMRAFSLSYGTSTEKDLIPINVYMLFQ